MNSIVIVGNLGKDPEMRYLKDGTPVTSLSVASNDYGKTTWFRVSVFGKQAENCNNFLAKGRKVAVNGRVTADENGNVRIWESNDGPRASYEVRASEVEFLTKAEPAAAAGGDDPF